MTITVNYAIRVTTDLEIDWSSFSFDSKQEKYPYKFFLWVVESGKTSGKRHYHLAVEFCSPVGDGVMKGVKNRIRELCQISDVNSGDVGSKKWDGADRYISYLCKENDPQWIGTPSAFAMLTPDEYRARFEVEKKIIKIENKQKGIIIVDKVIQNINLEYPLFKTMNCNDLRELIIKQYFLLAEKYNYKYHRLAVQRHIEEIEFSLSHQNKKMKQHLHMWLMERL